MNCRAWWRASSLPNALRCEQALGSEVQRTLGHADPAHRVGQAAAGQAPLGDDETLALGAEQVAQRDADVGQRDLGCPPGECEPSHSGWRSISQPGVSVGTRISE